MNHLRTHPSVAGRLAQRNLEISGWVYDIAHGTTRIHDESKEGLCRLKMSSNTFPLRRVQMGELPGVKSEFWATLKLHFP